MSADLHMLPSWPQSQEPLATQLASLIQIANRLGLYDAADTVKQMSTKLTDMRYGCYVDLDPGMEPDGCVIDTGDLHNCIYAKKGMRKEQCEYWKIITTTQTEGVDA